MNYKLLCENDIFLPDIKETIARNRGLPADWCKREFNKRPSFDFAGLEKASKVFLHHLMPSEIQGAENFKQKFQIVVDSDLDGIASATILYKFLQEFYPEIKTIYSIHTGKQHGLSDDIIINDESTLVLCPDSASNDVVQCAELHNCGIDVICLDHHIIEKENLYASIVSCMDGIYPNQNLCGAAVTWLFLYGFVFNRVQPNDDMIRYLLSMLDLVAIATISDIMSVTNKDNMFFIQNGLENIKSEALKAFLNSQEVPLNDVTIEHIKFKVAPLISAMIRMGSMEEKTLLFRAFIDDYEEFDYEKRGSLSVDTENIYDRVVRLCKNAKSRQDRAKQKLLDNCQIYEYENILLVEYQDDKSSTLTGLVANELANQYCKPCIVYHRSGDYLTNSGYKYSGSIRNYDGSPITSFKNVLQIAFGVECMVSGHDNAAGIYFFDISPDEFEKRFSKVLFEAYYDAVDDISTTPIGEKEYSVDFEIDANEVDVGFVQRMAFFDHYSGYGFAPVTVLIHGIQVDAENFKTMGKNSLSWKICGDGVDYVKFKIQKDDVLLKEVDDIDFGFTTDKVIYIDAICTFGINVYKGEAHAQAIIKDYELIGIKEKEKNETEDWDLDLDF